MKYFGLFLLLLLTAGCRQSVEEFRLNGKIENLDEGVIYIYGWDEFYDRMDTVYVEKGRFTYTAPIDTTTTLILMVDSVTAGEVVYANKGISATLKGNYNDLSSIRVSGGEFNDEYSLLKDSLFQLKDSSLQVIQDHVLNHITDNSGSLVCVYLLDKYFVQVEDPDYAKVKEIINLLSGELQDHLYINQLTKFVDSYQKIKPGNRAPQFNIKDEEGETVSLQKYRGKVFILDFWAAWDSLSLQQIPEKKRVYKALNKKKKFDMLSFSLDLDKEQWKDQIEKDTLEWKQVATLEGWKFSLVESYGIKELPTTFLIDSIGRVVAINLEPDSLINKVEELLKTRK